MNFKKILENNAKPDKPGAEAEEAVSNEYFAVDRIKSTPTCLDLRLIEGRRKALPYAYVLELRFDTENGIEIFTAREKISIMGRNLSKLFDYLITYRVRYIQVDLGADTQEDGLFVSEIIFESLDA